MGKGMGKGKRFGAWLLLGVLAFFLTVYSPRSWAAEEPYPSRPINTVIAYGPGASADLSSRIMGERMAEFLGQPLIMVYKPGGGGSLGAAYAAKAKPDGYTVLVASASMIIIPPIVKKLDFKMEDFTLMGSFSKIPIFFVVRKDARWKTLKEFVEEAKRYPQRFQVGTYGKLSLPDFLLELFNRHAGINLINLPFKSVPESLSALLGGHIEACITAGAAGQLEAGTIRILAVSDERRLDGLPDVPTFKEEGYPIATPAFFSFAFPRETPPAIVDRFADAQQKAVEKYRKQIALELRKVEQWADFRTPQDTLKTYKEQHDLYFKIAQELGVVAK